MTQRYIYIYIDIDIAIHTENADDAPTAPLDTNAPVGDAPPPAADLNVDIISLLRDISSFIFFKRSCLRMRSNSLNLVRCTRY